MKNKNEKGIDLIKPDRSTIQKTKVRRTNPDKSFFNRAQVTFVGNSGFLIAVGDKKVLIDAFFEGFPPGYTLPVNVRDLLVNAQPPFENVDLILAAHAHEDHFSAAMVRQYLQTCPTAVFVSTTQAASQLSGFGDRVIAADPIEATPVNLEANGIRVEAIYISHGYPPMIPMKSLTILTRLPSTGSHSSIPGISLICRMLCNTT